MAIGENGRLWGWGETRYGKLGTDDESKSVGVVPLQDGVQWLAVGGGQQVSVGVTTDGQVWSWGERLGERSRNFRRIWEQIRYAAGMTVPRRVPHSESPKLLKVDWRSRKANVLIEQE